MAYTGLLESVPTTVATGTSAIKTINSIILRFGTSQIIHSDRSPHFKISKLENGLLQQQLSGSTVHNVLLKDKEKLREQFVQPKRVFEKLWMTINQIQSPGRPRWLWEPSLLLILVSKHSRDFYLPKYCLDPDYSQKYKSLYSRRNFDTFSEYRDTICVRRL
jgi:hypothetical protein